VTCPFEQEQELADALSELSKVNAELDVGRSADDGALLDEDEQNDQDEEALGLDEDDELEM
jgi:hypothetical protein